MIIDIHAAGLGLPSMRGSACSCYFLTVGQALSLVFALRTYDVAYSREQIVSHCLWQYFKVVLTLHDGTRQAVTRSPIGKVAASKGSFIT